MSHVQWDQTPNLRRPIMLVAFEGWFDAGECATTALNWLATRHRGVTVAGIDPEEFFDFQESRPHVGFDDDGQRVIEWPRNEIVAASTAPDHDLLLLAGVEPRLKWRTFCDSLVEIITETSTELVITVGAMVGNVPHTRAPSVKGSASDARLAERLGLGRPTYEGPTGVVGAFHDALDRAGVPVISIRVSVPHYVSGPQNPKGQQALLRRLEHLTGVEAEADELDEAVSEWEQRVSNAVGSDEEVMSYVARLEAEADANSADEIDGDELASEIEEFLRGDPPAGDGDA